MVVHSHRALIFLCNTNGTDTDGMHAVIWHYTMERPSEE